jgi:hypothetical protein
MFMVVVLVVSTLLLLGFTFLEESLGRDRLIPDGNVRGKSEKSLHSDF